MTPEESPMPVFHGRCFAPWLFALIGVAGCQGLADRPGVVRGADAVPESVTTTSPMSPSASAPQPPVPRPAAYRQPLSIDLVTVLKLAEESNPQVALARERVSEALADKTRQRYRWLPDVYVGPAYYKHEGNIQLEDGTIIRSSSAAQLAGLEVRAVLDPKDAGLERADRERRLLQQQGDERRITQEVLLDATTTYVDLLTAQFILKFNEQQEDDYQQLLKDTKALVAAGVRPQIEVDHVEAGMKARLHSLVKLRQQIRAASAKLAYLLGMDPACVELLPADGELAALQLIEPSLDADQFVALVLRTGPGLVELEGLLRLANQGVVASQNAGLIPALEVTAAEGAFAGGPGSALESWDDRFDFAVRLRWNLKELAGTEEKRWAAAARARQVQFTYQELCGKLTLAVLDAHFALAATAEQMQLSQEQMDRGRDALNKSKQRFKNAQAAADEVLLALRSVATIQADYLTAIAGYNKGQLRLMLMVGPDVCRR